MPTDKEIVLEKWPDCPVKGCPNKICLSLGSDKCYPHSMNGISELVDSLIEIAARMIREAENENVR